MAGAEKGMVVIDQEAVVGHGVGVFVCACALWNKICPHSRDIRAHLFQDDSILASI